MNEKEIFVRKTLDFLLEHVGKDDLNLLFYAIEDYEQEGYDLFSYKEKIKELRVGNATNNG